MPLLEKVGLSDSLDDGCVELSDVDSVRELVDLLEDLRIWEREETLAAEA